ncbi:DUF2917 domain-containing protein [Bordetella sp. 2513F-2]
MLDRLGIVYSTGMSFALGRGSVVRLRRAAGARIVCRTGALWLSEYRPGADRVLRAGESVLVASRRDVVLSGLPQACIAIRLQKESCS